MAHIIFYPEDEHYVAHCLEFDLVAQGDNVGESSQNLLDAVELQTAYALETGYLENLIQPAPPEFWHMLLKSEDNHEVSTGLRLPRILSGIECSVVYG